MTRGQIEAEGGFPIPEKWPGNAKYPWHKLAVGDSFFVPESPGRAGSDLQRQMLFLARRKHIKVTTRVVEGGVRVWRTA